MVWLSRQELTKPLRRSFVTTLRSSDDFSCLVMEAMSKNISLTQEKNKTLDLVLVYDWERARACSQWIWLRAEKGTVHGGGGGKLACNDSTHLQDPHHLPHIQLMHFHHISIHVSSVILASIFGTLYDLHPKLLLLRAGHEKPSQVSKIFQTLLRAGPENLSKKLKT